METVLSIGKLAREAGVGVETIRYYQRRDLLMQPPKQLGGQRRYPATVIKRLRFIKRAQALGFSLDEVATLLALDQAHACAPTRALAKHNRALLDRKIADLTALRAALGKLIRECDAHPDTTRCPIIETLTHD